MVLVLLFFGKEKGLSIGREATPTISSLLTGSDDIQIDSIKQLTKLGRDIKKANHNKDGP